MKNIKQILFILALVSSSWQLKAQAPDPNSYNQNFEPIKAFDRFGNSYSLDQLQILESGSSHAYAAIAPPTMSCSAGYFNIYFGVGSDLDVNNATQQARRDVVCQVFYDISNFINSPLNFNTGTPKVNVIIDDLSNYVPAPSSSGVLATASSYYAEKLNTTSTGIIPGEVWKTIKLGNDSYINTVPLAGQNYYHGFLAFNFKNTGLDWDLSLSTNTITSGQNDFYTVVLHEAMHMLGIASLIANNGNSSFGPNSNYYSFYDAFLKNSSNVSLITNSANSCTKYNHVFNASTSNLAPGTNCPTYTTDVSTCTIANQYVGSVTLPIYTPDCYENGGSLSHFEDYCYAPASFSLTPPASNNKYFTMSNSQVTGTGAFKRYLKPEERLVLCDLGYNVNSTNSSTVYGASFNYSTSTCPGKDIAGLNDGMSGNNYTYTTTIGMPVAITGINTNDRNAGGGYECLQVVSPFAGNLSGTSGSYNNTFTYTPTSGSGLHILRYLPKNSAGEQGNITYIYVLVLPSYACTTNTCNLVTNGNFEQGGNPISTGDIYYACGWESANPATPDYFKTTASSPVGIPCNLYGNETNSINGGNSYSGIFCFNSTNSLTPSYNEIIYTKLTNPLSANTSYKIAFDVSLAETASSEAYPLQVYFSTNASFISSSQSTINIGNPAMLFTTPNTFTVSSGWQQGVISFTTGSSAGQQYIAIGNLTNNAGVLKSAAASPTTCPSSLTLQGAYYYIDNVILVANPVVSTFNLPTNSCNNQSITLNSLATPTGGVFSGTGITTTSGVCVFNSGQNISPGTYDISYTFTNTNGCATTLLKQISVGIPHDVTVSANNAVICSNLSQTNSTLTASSNSTGVSFYWQPGSFTTNSIVVSPTIATVYTVTGNNQGCLSTATLAINVSSACCTSSVPAFNGNSFNTTGTYTNPLVFNSDITIQAGVVRVFWDTEYLFAPNVKITVKTGASLTFNGCHLYACSDMWKGIVVEDGGRLSLSGGTYDGHDCLIEDAITAVDVSNNVTSTITPAGGGIIKVSKTIFNKNYVGINVSNYQHYSSPYPFEIYSTVFTSRTLTFTPTNWPSCSSTSVGLRASSTATDGLAAPYLLQNFAISNLKSPYSSQSAHKGIQLSAVGTTSNIATFNSIQIGRTTYASDFNIFDALGQGIEATNSNVLSLNNVFQNTQQYSFDPPGPAPAYLFGGNAIRHVTTNDFNSKLSLSANSYDLSFGNRFYNCHYAVNCDKAFYFECHYATFRSTQSSTNTVFGPGNTGISLRTNRLFYKIEHNNFANISTAINIPLNLGTFSITSNQYGIYPSLISIAYNYIGAQVNATTAVTDQYIDKAITISMPLINPAVGNIANFSIVHNNLNKVFRGIDINAASTTSFAAATCSNIIHLAEDNVFFSNQKAIKLTNNLSGSTRSNTLSANSPTNTQSTLVFASYNTNATVTCNDLSDSYQGFEFNNSNLGTEWKGNIMENHERGMVLSNNGVIGAQGNSGFPNDNSWNGTWTGSNNGTYVDAFSNASLSKLWVQVTGNYFPPNNAGPFASLSYTNPSNLSTTTGSYSCGITNNSNSNSSNYIMPLDSITDDNYLYTAQTASYRYLIGNDSVRNSNSDYGTFCSSLRGTSIEAFSNVEDLIIKGDLESADGANTAITPTNNVEQSYQYFYGFYYRYLTDQFSVDDSLNLLTLANGCPGYDGTSIYQARALFNDIFKVAYSFYDGCGAGREQNTNENASITKFVKWDCILYPNPANNFVTLVSKNATDQLVVSICDVNGRLLMKKDIQINNYSSNLDLDLKNGIYFVSIINSKHEKANKKLVIAK